MKELSIEEKAKAYDRALGIAKAWCKLDNNNLSNDDLETLFPELRESEDERIRKALLEMVHDTTGDELWVDYNVYKEEALAWLENQGEQKPNYTTLAETGNGGINALVTRELSANDYEEKPANEIEPKFHRDEWVVFNNHHASVYRIEKIENHEYTLRHFLGGSMPLSFSHEDIIRLWTIEDAEDGDVLCDYHETYDNPLIFILKKFEHVNFGLVRPSDYSSYCFLTAGDIQKFKEGTYHHKHNIKPATKEQRDTLFAKMKEAGYEWNAEKKELKKIEQKSAWSEEDEKKVNNLYVLLDQMVSFNMLSDKDATEFKDWLKSLRPHKTWKPSEEQIEILDTVLTNESMDDNIARILRELRGQLKKLKER